MRAASRSPTPSTLPGLNQWAAKQRHRPGVPGSPRASSPATVVTQPCHSEPSVRPLTFWTDPSPRLPGSLPLPPHASQLLSVLSALWPQAPAFPGTEPSLLLEKTIPTPGPVGTTSHPRSLSARALSVPSDRNPADFEGGRMFIGSRDSEAQSMQASGERGECADVIRH